MRPLSTALIAGSLLLAGLALPLFAQSDDDEPEYRPGLVATITAADGTSITRVDEDVQLDGLSPGGDPRPDLRLRADQPWQARWQGRLFTIVPGSYRLHVYAAGNIKITLTGRTLLETAASEPKWIDTAPFESTYGHHPITIDYTPSSQGARLGLFWSGPQFALEPIPDRHWFHDPSQTSPSAFESGRLLAHALQCGQCHRQSTEPAAPRGPDLSRLNGQINPGWIVERLTVAAPTNDASLDVLQRSTRMPHFAMPVDDATAIATWLTTSTKASPPPESTKPKPRSADKSSSTSKGKPKPRTEPSADAGRTLVHALGCLGCHTVNQIGTAHVFGGGDLSRIAEKRPANFFSHWLESPEKLNERHRMPVFRLEALERADVALYLASLKSDAITRKMPEPTTAAVARGAQLFDEYRCAACHGSPTGDTRVAKTVSPLTGEPWKGGCLGTQPPVRNAPAFGLNSAQQLALQEFYGARNQQSPAKLDGSLILAERNCLGCHARGAQPGITPRLTAVTAALPELGPVLPTLIPPSLTGVGDKLHDAALRAAIELKHEPRRKWLQVRMPKFTLHDDEVAALNRLFIGHDRLPPRDPGTTEAPLDAASQLAAQRLVTADGFGCTSCHKIGSSEPVKVALNAQGTDLTLLGERIRKPWFDRWVRNPARIIPRMEMPAIQKPVRGVLHDNVDEQLAAVWTTLNTPGFNPPPPNPVRVVRTTNLDNPQEPAVVLTDVIEVSKRLYLRPVVVGLPNRHNVLFDLERGGLAAWWLGDTGRERTRGKSWYWESGSSSLFSSADALPPRLIDESSTNAWSLDNVGQFAATLDRFEHHRQGIRFAYRLRFRRGEEQQSLSVVETYLPRAGGGVQRMAEVGGLRQRQTFMLPVTPERAREAWRATNATTWTSGPAGSALNVRLVTPADRDTLQADEGLWVRVTSRNAEAAVSCMLEYTSELAADQFHPVEPKLPPLAPVKLSVVPGFETLQLPLPADEMPTGLAWRADGRLFFTSLKGRLCTAIDSDGDGLEDKIQPVSDDFAAPYGLHVNRDSIDVINKYALLRLHDQDGDGFFEQNEVMADDWGYTSDYHDWAVGLPKDAVGNYYVALPCQQDNRSPAAAHRRGTTIRLRPTARDPQTQRSFQITPFTAGHRFPMGLAINRDQAIFVTDNQGNYTPFNELNHLREGRRYGFINKLEAKPDFAPPFEFAAISIPHPWTRSVNGICFLYTPAAVRVRLGLDVFGPFEGHLVGCEFNGLSLVRMSIEPIGDTYQGAIYPLSVPPQADQPTFEGPVVCEVGPSGDLYVGNVRDSGWGGGQNTGSIVRMRPTGQWPLGIAEVRARPQGFQLRFTGPIDEAKATAAQSYHVRSYRRIPTPAYGGNDVDERTEHIERIELATDRQSVVLQLNSLREGYVYEIRTENLGATNASFHPAEAHYTLLKIPSRP